MANRSLHYRHVTVSCLTTAAEHQRLRTICEALNVPVHEVLMAGVRRFERHWAKEKRRQRLLEEERD